MPLDTLGAGDVFRCHALTLAAEEPGAADARFSCVAAGLSHVRKVFGGRIGAPTRADVLARMLCDSQGPTPTSQLSVETGSSTGLTCRFLQTDFGLNRHFSPDWMRFSR